MLIYVRINFIWILSPLIRCIFSFFFFFLLLVKIISYRQDWLNTSSPPYSTILSKWFNDLIISLYSRHIQVKQLGILLFFLLIYVFFFYYNPICSWYRWVVGWYFIYNAFLSHLNKISISWLLFDWLHYSLLSNLNPFHIGSEWTLVHIV